VAWSALSQELLGLTPPTDKQGVLQDVQRSGVALGYFPSYSPGNMMRAQVWFTVRAKFSELYAEFAPVRGDGPVVAFGLLGDPGKLRFLCVQIGYVEDAHGGDGMAGGSCFESVLGVHPTVAWVLHRKKRASGAPRFWLKLDRHLVALPPALLAQPVFFAVLLQ